VRRYVSIPCTIGYTGCQVRLKTASKLKLSGGLGKTDEDVLHNVLCVTNIIQKSHRQPQQVIAVFFVNA